jgi:hypothetical protein
MIEVEAPTLARALLRPPRRHEPTHRPSRPRGVRDFYADKLAWAGLALCALALTYGGGAAMFWFHAIELGEGGPAISPWLHWGLDSTAGFLGLTPLIAVIVPVAAWAAVDPGGRVRAWRFAAVGGMLLAVLTAPAPLLHDRFLARGTWLAGRITELWGDPRYAAAPEHHHHAETPLFDMGAHVVAGIPTYVVLSWLGLGLARAALSRGGAGAGGRRRPPPPPPPAR